MRAPYQVLAFPFIIENNKIYYALFKRADLNVWQGISGGGEYREMPVETVKREAFEECGIPANSKFMRLASIASIPAIKITSFKENKKILVVPEFCFGVELKTRSMGLSKEHTQCKWFEFDSAIKKLKWDSNKNTLWELNYRLLNIKKGNAEDNIKVIKKYV